MKSMTGCIPKITGERCRTPIQRLDANKRCAVTVKQIEAARRIVPIVSVQNRYSLADRASENVLLYCEKHGIAFLPWYPLGDGSALRLPSVRKLAQKLIAEFETFDYVVIPSGSCAGMIRAHYAELFADVPDWRERVQRLAAKTYELTEIRFRNGESSEVDVQQAKSSLVQTEALVPQVEATQDAFGKPISTQLTQVALEPAHHDGRELVRILDRRGTTETNRVEDFEQRAEGVRMAVMWRCTQEQAVVELRS